jgi:hypothetical protein
VLLIGFHKNDANMYPHLRCIIDRLSVNPDFRYFHFRERGYVTQRMMSQRTKFGSLLTAVRAFLSTTIDSILLWSRHRHHDTVIAVDHYAYAIACAVLRDRHVILWSHDIISHDSAIYGHSFVRRFMGACARSLERNKRVIVQDPDRLILLRHSLNLRETELDVFYMPVCLEPLASKTRKISSSLRPRLLQSGGIGRYRSSDKLLAHYQENSNSYRLYFHGFVFKEIVEQLANSDVQPMVSSRTVNPKLIYQLTDYCDIGFVSYEDENNLNFFFIANASGQLVEFLRIGMPVIVMGRNNLREFVEKHHVGIGIDSITSLNEAIQAIVQQYDGYSDSCLRCFDSRFSCERYFPNLPSWLSARPS